MNFKKADSMGLQFIIVIIVAIAFAVIYFFWLGDYKAFGDKLADYQICKSSNYESALLKLSLNNWAIEQRKGNKCKTEYIDVKKDKELETIAKTMAGCWDMYLEGKKEIFETKDANYCAFCSVLTFEEKKDLKGLTTYLMEKKVPNREITYYDYLTRTTVTKDTFQEVENSELNKHAFGTEIPLSVIFVMQKNANPGSLTGQSSTQNAAEGASLGSVAGLAISLGFGLCSSVVGCTVGAFLIGAGTAATGYLIGSNYGPNLDTKILLWPYTQEDLKKLDCTILEGQDNLEIKK